MPQAMSNEVKETLTNYLSAGIAEHLRVSVKGYFDDPASPEARGVMLTAVAHAIRQVTASDPTARASLRAFALELLETLE